MVVVCALALPVRGKLEMIFKTFSGFSVCAKDGVTANARRNTAAIFFNMMVSCSSVRTKFDNRVSANFLRSTH